MAFHIMDFKEKSDHRGSLVALESGATVPFDIKRLFYIYGVQSDAIRGNHAHKASLQILICLHGQVSVTLDDVHKKETITLNTPNKGVLIEEKTWVTLSDFSHDCVVLAASDIAYSPEDYLCDYNEFVKMVSSENAS